MSSLVSLCIIRIEMEDETVEGTRKEEDTGDVRPMQSISVETYASALSGPPSSGLLGAVGPHEPSPPPPAPYQDQAADQEMEFFFGNPLVEVTKGILHLYKENEATDASVEAPSRILCLLAVPATVSCRDLLVFTAACQRDIQHVRVLRDSSPDRYMALITFRSRGAAYEFRETFGGTAYSSLEPGAVCHAAWVRRIECTRGSTPPPPAATELPTCPVCLERMDESVEGLLTVQCSHSFHSGCLGAWKDGSCPVCRCAQSPDPPAASECGQCALQDGDGEAVEGGALWICLICGHVGCGRYQAGHAAQHFRASNHTYAMQLGTNRVWDYAGDNFVHRLLQNKTDGKLVAAGGPTDPDACAPATQEKLDSIQLECAHLLATQLDTQRRHYEELLAREKAAALVETEQLKEKLKETEKNVSQLNKKMTNLSTKVSTLQTKLAEEKAMASAAVQARSELALRATGGEAEIASLREQVRDLAFYVQAASDIGARPDCQELQGGQLIVSPPQTKGRRGRKKQ